MMLFEIYYMVILISMLLVFGMGTFWLSLYFLNKDRILKRSVNLSFFPNISIIVPAYNEEKNIKNNLNSIFSSDYPKKKMEVIVVDDGSKDSTARIARQFPVNLIKHGKNRGKIYSLNDGIARAKSDIIITTDADTILEKNTIRLLVKKFQDPKVGAVAGVYKAINKYSSRNPFKFLLEKFQGLEYMGFSLIRKEQDSHQNINDQNNLGL